MSSNHPSQVLFAGNEPPVMPSCEHYAGTEKLIRKSIALQAELGPVFDLTCDCEDGAAVGAETAHADMVAGLLTSGPAAGARRGVRIQSPRHPLFNEQAQFFIRECGTHLGYITVPKIENLEEAQQAVRHIQSIAGTWQPELHLLIETSGAVEDVFEIARLPHVKVLDFGLMDFISSHGGSIGRECMKSPGQFEHQLLIRAKAEICAAAATAGIIASHNVTVQYNNVEQTYADALRARSEFGFLRMWSIHPAQIEPIVKAMSVNSDDLREIESILLRAYESDWAPVSHGGELHDRASYRLLWISLRRARASGQKLSPQAEQAFFA